ncbi:signal transducer and activator of transcription 6-like [Mercenaria mercenaria]|uniref:signal transducer and activator of transcription 6-like n=1 Tax=Mercenaria mercenaria TaxID=6596 RepID=UPI00234ECF24|nr:signal transducer and activator of transcription 6-like [Mercenaria mercenaria]
MTMSLPLVVTTGANQGCLSQASVMWQCYSTDIYSLPIEECHPLKWCEVAEMLQAKMQKLCPMRLTAENINHLKRRLFGRGDVPDDELVTLKKFCFDKLEKTDSSDDNTQLTFSFWKWFIGIYNLLDKYLLNFWKDGLIMGFVSKDEAKEKLKRCKNGKSGTFLLRFSDQNITDSQGVKSVFGHLTACVLIIKEEIDGRKKKKIYDMDVAGHKKLKEKNLANILKMTHDVKPGKIYQYLYPGDRTREETFDKYCDKDAVVPGYTGTKDAFVVHLDQQFAALEISCGKHARSPSVDSGIETIDTSSPLNSALSFNGPSLPAAKIKKPRVSVNHPTIAKILQQGSLDVSSPQNNPFAVPSPVYPGQSPCYPAQSPAPSAMSPFYAQTPSPANSTHSNCLSQDVLGSPIATDTGGLQQMDMSEQGSPKLNSLPTVIEDLPATTVSKDLNRLPMSDNGICSPASSCTTNQSPQRNGNDATHILIEGDDGQMSVVSFETGSNEVVVQQLSGHSSLESNSSCHSSVSNGQQSAVILPAQTDDPYMVSMGNNMFKRREPVTSTVPEQQDVLSSLQNNPELAQILSILNNATPDILKYLQSYLDQNMAPVVNDGCVQMSTEIDPAPACPVVTTSGTPHLTSSGSMSDAFNFSQNEIAEVQEMNSGTIDTSVFATVDSSSSGMMS